MFYTKDRQFFTRLFAIATPMVIRGVLSSSLNFIDIFMVGSLGDAAVAATSSGNQVFFVFNMLIFGLAGGTAIFSAQHWGKKDILSIRSVMGIGLTLTIGIATLFSLAALIFPQAIITFFTKDAAVILLGTDYLRIISLSFLITALSLTYSVVLSSTENVIYPMISGSVGVVVNTILNYLLIFGKFGFPELGVVGAAIATLLARIIEMLIIVIVTYAKKLPAAARVKDLFRFTKKQFGAYLYRALPVVLQTAGWSAGYSVYFAIYGHVSTEAYAAFSVASSVERLCLLFFTSLGGACSIMVGNRIGAGEDEKARGYAKNFLLLGVGISFVLSSVLFLSFGPIANIFMELTSVSRFYLSGILLVMAFIFWAKACNIIFHMGIFKAGGDTIFSMIVDVGGIWLVGIPIALIAAFFFKLPIHLVVACVAAEEIVKMLVGMKRYLSGRWLNNLVSDTAVKEV